MWEIISLLAEETVKRSAMVRPGSRALLVSRVEQEKTLQQRFGIARFFLTMTSAMLFVASIITWFTAPQHPARLALGLWLVCLSSLVTLLMIYIDSLRSVKVMAALGVILLAGAVYITPLVWNYTTGRLDFAISAGLLPLLAFVHILAVMLYTRYGWLNTSIHAPQ